MPTLSKANYSIIIPTRINFHIEGHNYDTSNLTTTTNMSIYLNKYVVLY